MTWQAGPGHAPAPVELEPEPGGLTRAPWPAGALAPAGVVAAGAEVPAPEPPPGAAVAEPEP